MKKLTIATFALLSMFSFTIASAEVGVKIGASIDIGEFEATGNDSENGTVSAAEKATALVGYGSLFIEKDLSFLPGPLGRLSIGYSHVPHDMKTGTADAELIDCGTKAVCTGQTDNTVVNKVQADLDNYNTYYATLNVTDWLYVKGGTVEVDVTTNEKLGTGSKYGNTSLDGTVFGAGFHLEQDNGFFMRLEVNQVSFDSVTLTATNNSDNKVTLGDLEGTTGKLAIGKSF